MIVQAPNDINKQINDRIKEVLLGMPINFDIDNNWYFKAQTAIFKKSPIGLGMTAKEYGDLIEGLQNLEIQDCWAFSGINNEMQDLTMEECGYCLYKDYVKFMEQLETYAIKWNEQAGPVREEVGKAMMEEFLKAKANNVKTMVNPKDIN